MNCCELLQGGLKILDDVGGDDATERPREYGGLLRESSELTRECGDWHRQ